MATKRRKPIGQRHRESMNLQEVALHFQQFANENKVSISLLKNQLFIILEVLRRSMQTRGMVHPRGLAPGPTAPKKLCLI